MENKYKTKDIAEASALLVSKIKMENIIRDGSICWFIFDDYKKSKEISDLFFFGDLTVNARDYYETLVRLKNRIFSR